MDAAQLRQLGDQCHAAADHLDQQKGQPKSRGLGAAGGFDWKSLVKFMLQGAMQLLDSQPSASPPKA